MIKATKFGDNWLNGFRVMEIKPGDGPVCPPPPPPPRLNRGKEDWKVSRSENQQIYSTVFESS